VYPTKLVLLPIFLLAFTPTSIVRAKSPSCGKCGCHEYVKKVTCLVCVWEEIKTPVYECAGEEVFVPHKGKVCHRGYRCDTVCKFKKHCDCRKDCCGHLRCDCTTTCCGKTKCSCQTHFGADPSGCFSTRCVSKPADEYVRRVPVYKWVTYSLCRDCCGAKTSH